MARNMRGTRPGNPSVYLQPERTLTKRSLRSPQHSFRLKVRPWQLVPAGIAPVLPGDTVKAASLKMRVLSKPLADKLSGWWLETFLFYVRLGDMNDTVQADFKSMILADQPLSTVSADKAFYQPGSRPGFLIQCYEQILYGYFRNEDSLFYPPQIGDYEVAKIAGPGGVFDSLAVADTMEDGPPDDADFWEKQWEAFQGTRQAKLTTATWEEYLAMNGIQLPPQLVQTPMNRRPELLHFTRDWQFPVQAVEPSTGTPSALVQWSLADRLKRARFCAEPGWLVQIVLCRPKAYLKNQRGYMASYLMGTRNSWFPPALDQDPHARLMLFTGGGPGPAEGATKDYWVDPQDFLARGDQFTNYDLSAAVSGVNLVDLPKDAGMIGDEVVNTLYPTATDADACFSGADKYIEVDGVTTYQIASVAARGDVTGKRRGMA